MAREDSILLEAHVVLHLHERVLVDEHLLGVAPEVGELGNERPVPHQWDMSSSGGVGLPSSSYVLLDFSGHLAGTPVTLPGRRNG